MAIQKIFTSRSVANGSEFVGEENRLWFNEQTKTLHYSDGETAGGRLIAGGTSTANGSGWALYRDTVNTSVTPLTLIAQQPTYIPNNAGVIFDTQLPTGVTSFYNTSTQKITPAQRNDYYIITARFKAISSINGSFLDLGLDTQGLNGYIFKETLPFTKGAGVEQAYSYKCPGFVSANFLTNGGRIVATANNGNIELYDIEYQIARVHTAL